jgi:hypothetical protein
MHHVTVRDEQGEVMTDDAKHNQPAPDVPGERSPALEAMNVLVGTWSTEFVHVALPDPVHGQTTFEWLDGGRFLIQRSHAQHPQVPGMIGVIGADESGDELVQNYFDSRGVHRTYKMSLRDGIWKVWRDAPGFSQRFEGRISDDGNTIKVLGELCRDDAKWERDFEQTYTKS